MPAAVIDHRLTPVLRNTLNVAQYFLDRVRGHSVETFQSGVEISDICGMVLAMMYFRGTGVDVRFQRIEGIG